MLRSEKSMYPAKCFLNFAVRVSGSPEFSLQSWFHKVVWLSSFSLEKFCIVSFRFFGSVSFLRKVEFLLDREFAWQCFVRSESFLVIAKVWVVRKILSRWVRFSLSNKKVSVPWVRPTQRAPDWWESARFQALSVASSWFRQSGVISSRPPAGNADR